VLRFFPGTAYFERTALSERALAYSDEPFSHRAIVVYEAAGMAGEMGSYLIRSLLSEGRLKYEAVEKTKEGLRARLIEKEGPTSLIVTTTAPRLHPENETRLLSLTVTDTQSQTKAILRALASDGEADGTVNYAQWQAFQAFLDAGEHRVDVPFADRLAELIPPLAVRLRRDFSQLLSLIRAHALLHRELRDQDERGHILATVDDYAVVRELVSDLFAEHVGATVKETTRLTVEAVRGLGKDEASISEIAKTLKLDRSACSRRVAEAVAGGYLKNHETNKGKPARISVGDPLPAEIVVLPAANQLRVCTRTAFSTDADGKKGHEANSLDNACTRAGVSGEYIHPPLPNGGAAPDESAERAAIFEYEAGYPRPEAERLARPRSDDGPD
jgi:DNA-binding Lrp family transcriptional regulator